MRVLISWSNAGGVLESHVMEVEDPGSIDIGRAIVGMIDRGGYRVDPGDTFTVEEVEP